MKTYKEFNAKPTIQSTLAFAKKIHDGQHYGSEPYWTHVKAVADAGKKLFGSKFETGGYLASLIHDSVEDTPTTLEDLEKMGYSAEVISVVSLVTKDKNLSYEANIQKIISSGNKLAMMVKYADNFVNFNGDKSRWEASRAAKSNAKYEKSMKLLGTKLGMEQTND